MKHDDLETIVRSVGMDAGLMAMGAASCIYSEGCDGVTLSDLFKLFAAIEAHTGAAPAQATIDVLRAEVERLTRELAALAQAGGDDAWISVNDRLPPEFTSVIACNGCGFIGRASVEHGRWNHIGGPTHWMPLPKPPLHRLTDSALPCAGTNCGATTGSGTPNAQA